MSFWDGLISEAMLVSGILDLDAQSSLLPMIPTILSRQKGFLCHATRQTRSNWQRFIAWPESQNDLNRTTDMQAESLGESGESGSQTCKHVRYIVGICIYIYTRAFGLVPPKLAIYHKLHDQLDHHSLFTQRWRSKRFTQVLDEVRKLTSCLKETSLQHCSSPLIRSSKL